VLDAAKLAYLRQLCARVYLDEQVENYILDIVAATRTPAAYKLHTLSNHIAYGASPRATINLALAARALAMLNKRAYVVPDDVISLAPDVLRHRIGLTYEAEAEDKDVNFVIQQILQAIPAP
jgi:MoxR-like ATPase